MISIYYHLAVLFVISRATDVSSKTNPSSSTSSTSLPANSNRLLETALHRHCPIPDRYDTDCKDQNIDAGTNCNLFYICPEHSFSTPQLFTCQENGHWADFDENKDSNCIPDSCPVEPGFQMYSTGGCEGRNELGHFENNNPNAQGVTWCADLCRARDTCVSFVVAKRKFVFHAEAKKCYLSETCHHEDTEKLATSDDCFYERLRGHEDDVTPNSNNEGGEASHYRHCLPSDVYPELDEEATLFATNCDGNILVNSKCDFWKFCKEEQYSLRGTKVCQEDGSWAGDTLDPNCYSRDSESEPQPEVSRSENDDTPSNNGGDDGEDACLAYDSVISLADGTTQPIHSLEVGTNVALGNDGQSAIVFFSHADKFPVMRNMVTIRTQETNITATRNHLIFSSENEGVTLRNLRAFGEVKVGDYVLLDMESGPVSTQVVDIIFELMLTRVHNAVPQAGYLIANKIFVAAGSAFGVLPHWLQFPVVHAVSMLVCGISEQACQIDENDNKPKWVSRVQEWITKPRFMGHTKKSAAMELNRVSSAMLLTGSYN